MNTQRPLVEKSEREQVWWQALERAFESVEPPGAVREEDSRGEGSGRDEQSPGPRGRIHLF